ncbi:MAG TPA: polyphosphate polymerase domain-containing protein [Caldilineaceae bacterium]|nr:polyphosphate polymerase domain-containing protein [Caldilineaceae bacterium]
MRTPSAWPTAQPEYSAFQGIVETFAPISLAEMDAVALLDRIDLKFLLTPDQLLAMLAPLAQSYRALSVNHVRLNRYRTLYFDTPNFAFYHVHHNGSQGRFKVRFRSYVDSELTFFEVKGKNNKGRTFKRRLRVPQIETSLDDRANDFLCATLPAPVPPLEAKLWNNFVRVTLVDAAQTERLTIDWNINFSTQGWHTQVPNLVIAELKQRSYGRGSHVLHLLHTLRAGELSFSKYCIGTALHYPHLKQNNFKPIFLRMHKLGAIPISSTI